MGKVHRVMEAVLFAVVSASPWAFGGVGPAFEWYLFIGITILLVLWAAKLLVGRDLTFNVCPVSLCLSAIVLLGTIQVMPIPRESLGLISPASARTFQRLLPQKPEVIGELVDSRILGHEGVATTISLNPGATRDSLVDLLALLVLFLIVRNNFSSAGFLRRLSWVALVNGGALALFGLIQFFGSDDKGTLYWNFPSSGSVFGPFVNRNHFAFYINMCIGLGLGLVLSRDRATTDVAPVQCRSAFRRYMLQASRLLAEPSSLWMVGGLTLMFSSVVFCLSRGGFVAMLGGATVCAVAILSRNGLNVRILSVVLSVAFALALLIWFGLDDIEKRLATLWTGEAIRDARLSLLRNSWPLITEYYLWGTGYGTFQFVEPLHMHLPEDRGTIYEHAHNDYLEDLIEGGVFKLALRLLAIGLLFRLGYKAFQCHVGNATGAHILGTMFAVTSISIHSFFEFGLYVPAIAVFATVICANLSGINSDTSGTPSASNAETRWQVARVAGAIAAIAFAMFFYVEGTKSATIDRLRSAARQLRSDSFQGLADREAEIPLLHDVVNLNQMDAGRSLALAEAYLDVYYQLAHSRTGDVTDVDPKLRPVLLEGLKHAVKARNLCPLLPEPHVRIAAYVEQFHSADPRSLYLERAKFLAPSDHKLWYLCGLQELADHLPEQACASWRESIRLSNEYLFPIMDRGVAFLNEDELLEKLLPPEPEVLFTAAKYLYPQPEATQERRPFLEKALAIYESSDLRNSPEKLLTKARVYQQLGMPAQALDAYQEAIAQDQMQIGWRFELANVLHQLGNEEESRRELRIILSLQPKHSEASRLLELIDRL